MVIFINGAFGIGKTTVARLLRNQLRRAGIADPERVGWLLHRAPAFLKLEGRGTGDFQDMPLWRRLTAEQIALVRLAYPYVVVPMTFSNADYLHEVLRRVQAMDKNVRVYRLTASWPTIEARLRGAGCDPATTAGAWRWRRARECHENDTAPALGAPVDAEGTPEEIVADLRGRLGV